MQVPLKCTWYRVKDNRTYAIEEISSNTYQPNAEDIGCYIKVEARCCDPEDGSGVAIGKFGPLKLDAQGKEQVE